jgi:hypothetical protein
MSKLSSFSYSALKISNVNVQMTNQIQSSNVKTIFDLLKLDISFDIWILKFEF